MIKMIVTVYRRPELSLEAFEAYWEGTHAPLVAEYGRKLGIRRYVQSYWVDAPEVQEFARSRGWVAPPEALAEVWWDSREAMEAGFATPEGQEASRILAEDEAKFCDMTRMAAFLSREFLVFSDFPPSKYI